MPLPLWVVLALAALGLVLGFDTAALAPRAAAWHAGLAAGLMPLILAAMIHFVPVLTRSAGPPGAVARLPLAALVAGALAVAGFARPQGIPHGIQIAAALALVVAVTLLAWLRRRARRALGAPHPCLAWYATALGCLVTAVAAVLAMPHIPSAQPALRLLHLHLNSLGFVGLTALATLQVLLPTALGAPDPDAAARLRRRLAPATLAVALVAAGATVSPYLAAAGALLLAALSAELLVSWHARFGRGVVARHGAAACLAAATLGLALLALVGVAHGAGRPDGRAMTLGFLAAFLLPLVSGAASQLLPVWLWPGAQGPLHAALRDRLGRHAGWRGAAFVASGLAVAWGYSAAAWLAAAALALFALQAALALAGAAADRS